MKFSKTDLSLLEDALIDAVATMETNAQSFRPNGKLMPGWEGEARRADLRTAAYEKLLRRVRTEIKSRSGVKP